MKAGKPKFDRMVRAIAAPPAPEPQVPNSVTRAAMAEGDRILTKKMTQDAIEQLAEQTFGSNEKASAWLDHPLGILNGRTPRAVAETSEGAQLVETILAKIEWGAPL